MFTIYPHGPGHVSGLEAVIGPYRVRTQWLTGRSRKRLHLLSR